MQVEDPNVLSQMGNKIFPSAEWESTKADMMKCVILSKFGQNPELYTKLKATGSTPLYECTRNRYWGTGWKHDAPNWEKSSDFPGANVLGNILMEVRDSVVDSSTPKVDKQQSSKHPSDGDREIPETSSGIEATSKKSSEEDMEIGATGGENPPHTTDPIADVYGEAGGDKEVTTTIPRKPKPNQHNEGTDSVNTTANISKSRSKEEKVGEETDSSTSHDSISFNSSTYLSGNTSFTRKSVSRLDGSLDVNKLMSWSLPKLDTSLLPGNKGGHKNSSFNPDKEASAASTPLLIAKNLEKFKRRKKSTAIEFGSNDERDAMRTLMTKLLKKT